MKRPEKEALWMMSDKLLQTDYHIGQDEDTLRLFELRNAATCCGYLLPTLGKLQKTFKLLDVGCGPASITFDLARMFPQAKIIGLDQSSSVIERNKVNAEKSAPGADIEFRVGNILQPDDFLSPEEIGSFDVVHEHACLIHIPDNVEALKQMRRVSKAKGGIIASRNGDLRSQILYPPCKEYSKLVEALYALNGADIETGRKIISKAMQAGWRRDQIQASASVLMTSAPEERKIFASSMLRNLADTGSDMSKSAKALGYKEDSLQSIRRDLEQFIEAKDGWRLTICSETICHNDS
jgi:ubiquinone/menaquinone biosynthesis C-methylase UbiE